MKTSAKKLSAKQLKEMIKEEIQTLILREELSGDDKELNSFLDKTTKTLTECKDKLLSLIEDGEKLAIKDLNAKHRNQMVTSVIGVAKKVHGILVHSHDFLKKTTG